MPVYEFLCPTCKSTFEVLRPISQFDQDADCPTCATRSVKTLPVIARLPRFGSADFAPLCEMEGEGSVGACACGGACMHGA